MLGLLARLTPHADRLTCWQALTVLESQTLQRYLACVDSRKGPADKTP